MRTYLKLPEQRGWKLLVILMFFVVVSCLLIYTVCQKGFCYLNNFSSYFHYTNSINHHDLMSNTSTLSGYHKHFSNSQIFHPLKYDIPPKFNFTIEGEYVIVFLHIQKTGGSIFGRHLVKNIDLQKPCLCYKDQKRCDCKNSKNRIWLVSRYSTGWMCGLHADWTELQNCVGSIMDYKEDIHRLRR